MPHMATRKSAAHASTTNTSTRLLPREAGACTDMEEVAVRTVFIGHPSLSDSD